LYVQLPVVSLSHNNSGQVVHPSPNCIIW